MTNALVLRLSFHPSLVIRHSSLVLQCAGFNEEVLLMRRRVLAAALLACLGDAPAQDRVLTHREQARLQRAWIERRFNTILSGLMQREGIDMWIIVSREYNDDPVFRSMSPVTTYSSRRRTILVFFDRGGDKGLERMSIGRFDYDGLFPVEKTDNDGQWAGLKRVVEAR